MVITVRKLIKIAHFFVKKFGFRLISVEGWNVITKIYSDEWLQIYLNINDLKLPG